VGRSLSLVKGQGTPTRLGAICMGCLQTHGKVGGSEALMAATSTTLGSHLMGLLLDPGHGGGMLVRKYDRLLPDYSALHKVLLL
jgi:hypothetical protein